MAGGQGGKAISLDDRLTHRAPRHRWRGGERATLEFSVSFSPSGRGGDRTSRDFHGLSFADGARAVVHGVRLLQRAPSPSGRGHKLATALPLGASRRAEPTAKRARARILLGTPRYGWRGARSELFVFSPAALTVVGEGPACDERAYYSHPRLFRARVRGDDARARAGCSSDGTLRPWGRGPSVRRARYS